MCVTDSGSLFRLLRSLLDAFAFPMGEEAFRMSGRACVRRGFWAGREFAACTLLLNGQVAANFAPLETISRLGVADRLTAAAETNSSAAAG